MNEIVILQYCIKNPIFFLKIKKHISRDFFEIKNYNILFSFFIYFYNKYNKLPNKNDSFSLKEKIEDGIKRDNFFRLVSRVYNDELEYTKEYIEDEIVKKIQNFLRKEALELAFEEDYSNLIKKLNKAETLTLDKDLGTDLNSEDIFDFIIDLNNEEAIHTGFNKLNDVLNGGFKKKELYCIAAIPGAGKSLFLGNFAIESYLDNKNVLFYTLEMSKERCLTRILANLFEENPTKIITNTKEQNKQKMKKIKSNGSFILKEYNANEISSNDIEAHLEELKSIKNFIPDLVIVDYLLLMKTNNKMNKDNSYSYMKTVSEELRNVSKKYDCPVITACQLNREAMGDYGGSTGKPTAKQLSESRGILDTADFLATIVNTPNDKKKDIIKLFVCKNRNGEEDKFIEFNIDYNILRITEKKV